MACSLCRDRRRLSVGIPGESRIEQDQSLGGRQGQLQPERGQQRQVHRMHGQQTAAHQHRRTHHQADLMQQEGLSADPHPNHRQTLLPLLRGPALVHRAPAATHNGPAARLPGLVHAHSAVVHRHCLSCGHRVLFLALLVIFCITGHLFGRRTGRHSLFANIAICRDKWTPSGALQGLRAHSVEVVEATIALELAQAGPQPRESGLLIDFHTGLTIDIVGCLSE
mmetsp:Transcript_11732/g.16123  ORF Transcript_11732/g.16123 Transcript_11732/m.16123 type:complete len:224 (+) Transcript_11732:3221-3892(+)